VYFPITRDAVAEKTASVPLEDLYGSGEMILVVDDVKSQREISCEMLERLRYRTKAVSGGEEAIQYLKEHSVDLLLLDMIMDPGINGLETYKEIKNIHPGQKAIIVSGFAETEHVKETLKLGAGRFIRKPVNLEVLGVALKEELRN
jgi:two-component system, cell cycle sensor histidine kinase and response regulator CckA